MKDTRKKTVLLGIVAVVVLAGATFGFLKSPILAGTSGVGVKGLSSWGETAPVTSAGVRGIVHPLSEDFTITQAMRFTMNPIISGWRVTENSGSGAESAIFNLATEDKVTTLKTMNSATPGSKLYNSLEKCSQGLTERYTSAGFLESTNVAQKGSVQTGAYGTYTVALANGDGLVMGKINYSYTDNKGVKQYAVRILRCGASNVLSILLYSQDSAATSSAVDTVLSKLVVREVR